MVIHEVRVHDEIIPAEHQLAWKLSELAASRVTLDADVAEMVVNRIIDTIAGALPALNLPSVVSAREQALARPLSDGAMVLGLPNAQRVGADWAAWANSAAVRALDFHDCFLDADVCHPSETIVPLLAVAQQAGRSGGDLVRGIAVAYEVQIALAKGLPLFVNDIDQGAHLGPAVTCGLGTLLGLNTPIIYQAVQQAAHVSYATRQSRKGLLSTWRTHAPGYIGKLAIEAVDRAMRGETAPSPLYEGRHSVLARFLGGPGKVHCVPLPGPGESPRAIMETCPKEHAAGYHGQAVIDLAFRMRRLLAGRPAATRTVIATKRFSHVTMGSGANDPGKWNPEASRETLDHSLMYIFAVALQDGVWHHEQSYAPERARRPDTVALWRKVSTEEDPAWNARYDGLPALERDHGGRATVTFADGTTVEDEIAVPNAHPRGATPFLRDDYVRKFARLGQELFPRDRLEAFIARLEQVPALDPEALASLCLPAAQDRLAAPARPGLFARRPP